MAKRRATKAEVARRRRSRAAKLGWKRRVAVSPELQAKKRSKASKLGWRRRRARERAAASVVVLTDLSISKPWEGFDDLATLQSLADKRFKGQNIVAWGWAAKIAIIDAETGERSSIHTVSVPFNESSAAARRHFRDYLKHVLARGLYGGVVTILDTRVMVWRGK